MVLDTLARAMRGRKSQVPMALLPPDVCACAWMRACVAILVLLYRQCALLGGGGGRSAGVAGSVALAVGPAVCDYVTGRSLLQDWLRCRAPVCGHQVCARVARRHRRRQSWRVRTHPTQQAHTHTQAHTGTYIKHKQRGRRPPTNQPNRYVYTHTVSSSHRQRDGDGANA
jgi:hypothetical protein